MRSSARLLALRLSVGLVLLPPASASAAPDGDASKAKGDQTPKKPKKPPSGSKPGEAGAASEGTVALGRKGARAKAKETDPSEPPLSKRKDRPWLKRWAPERNMLELGAFGGVLVPARDLELFEPRPELPYQGFLPLATVAPDVGIRAGYYPLRYLGLEVEGAFIPSSTLEDGYTANLWTARGHVLAQLPFSSITPFALFGAGALGVSSNSRVLGSDVDPAFHLGIGTKIYIDRRWAIRLDLRDVISPRRGIEGGATNSLEALLGLSFTLGRLRDRDERTEPEPEPEPEPTRDGDGDGFLDGEDACPTEPGVAPDGCPAPEDPDGDGFLGDDDACPTEPGVDPDGCPARDADGDGVLVPDDACPEEPESYNGFEDGDGCPDELPDAVQQFSGRLEGVNFELSKATLTKESLPVLDQAVEVLQKYPTVRIEVSGHTDNSGSREVNMGLSERRADSVKQYLVEHGVDPGRIVVRGAGPDEPIDTNASREGRANNRRIEFRVLE